MDDNSKRVRLGCYGSNITMAIVLNFSPLLFLTFRSLYNISFSLLGLLVLINFSTQLIVDLIFSFFSHKFNLQKSVKLIPLLSMLGLIVYALAPFLFKGIEYVGIALGTVVFSAASGLNEVLISPVVAALPSENPERDMSKLHAIYAWGVVAVVIVTTVFLLVFGAKYWFILPLIFCIVPLFCSILFFGSTLPTLETPEKVTGALKMLKNKTLWLVVLTIFLGGATEAIMSQWCSSYLEQSLGLEKIWGDIFGTATFALMLGLGRSLYGKYGKNVEKVLFISGIGAVVCFSVCILSPLPIFGLIACALSGLCVAMMWPGTLVVGAKRIPDGGLFIYAMMASGGDLGSALGAQLTGIVTDVVAQSGWVGGMANSLHLTIDQLAMKFGMGLGVLSSILTTLVFLYILRTKDKPVPLQDTLQ